MQGGGAKVGEEEAEERRTDVGTGDVEIVRERRDQRWIHEIAGRYAGINRVSHLSLFFSSLSAAISATPTTWAGERRG